MKQIKTQIPAGIPVPKFQLFQPVVFNTSKGKPVQAVITGMFYADFATAMLERCDMVGWRYELNKAIGKSEQELLDLIDAEVTFNAYEDALTPVSDE